MFRRIALVVCVLALFASAFAPAVLAAVTVGDTVLAYWEPGDAYFVGTVAEKVGDGYLIVFEDGDNAVVPESQIRKNDIKVGSAVVARWSDGKFYPGKVAKIVGRALYIHYDDGDKGWTPWSWIAVKP